MDMIQCCSFRRKLYRLTGFVCIYVFVYVVCFVLNCLINAFAMCVGEVTVFY